MSIKKEVIIKLIVVVSLLVILIALPIVIHVANTTNVLEMSIISNEYEFRGLSNNQVAHFNIYSNLTIRNISFKGAEIIFADGCLWDTKGECSFTNESLSYFFYEGICLMALRPITFKPGITSMIDYVYLEIYNYTLPVLPDGNYTIIIGERYAENIKELKNAGRISFMVKDGSIIALT